MGSPPEILLIGTGPGPLSCLTREAEHELLQADRVLFRLSAHPVFAWLRDLGKEVLAFDCVYATRGIDYAGVYDFIAAAVVKELNGTAARFTPCRAIPSCSKQPAR